MKDTEFPTVPTVSLTINPALLSSPEHQLRAYRYAVDPFLLSIHVGTRTTLTILTRDEAISLALWVLTQCGVCEARIVADEVTNDV